MLHIKIASISIILLVFVGKKGQVIFLPKSVHSPSLMSRQERRRTSEEADGGRRDIHMTCVCVVGQKVVHGYVCHMHRFIVVSSAVQISTLPRQIRSSGGV